MKPTIAASLFALSIAVHDAGASEVVVCTGPSHIKSLCSSRAVNIETFRKGLRWTLVNCGANGQTYINWLNGETDDFWRRCDHKLTRQGFAFADVTMVLNLNTYTRAFNDTTQPIKEVLESYVAAQRLFQEDAEARFPNLKQGYHMPGYVNDEWCGWRQADTVAMEIPAINKGIRNASKWDLGPDLQATFYHEIDFRDGCHLRRDEGHPGYPDTARIRAGKIIKSFFLDQNAEVSP